MQTLNALKTNQEESHDSGGVSGRVSFVIPARNEDQDVVAKTIQGILDTARGVEREIILIDDASETPLTFEHPEVTVIRNESPIGVSRARRDGSQRATGDAIVWLDGHMTFAEDWLDRLPPEVDSGALLCTPYMSYDRSQVYAWGSNFGWCARRKFKFGQTPGFIWDFRLEPPEAEVVEVPMWSGPAT